MAQQHGLDPPARADQAAQQFSEILFVHPLADMGQRPRKGFVGALACFLQQLVARLDQQLLAAPLIEQLEMRRHPGFQRKAAQQRLAEGMDRHDAHATRRIEDAGEQTPCPLTLLVAGRAAQQIHKRCRQFAVIHHRPKGQTLGDAVGHLRGGRLGEGEAE